jgi:hypothetical protein
MSNMAMLGLQAFAPLAGGIADNSAARAQGAALDEDARRTELQGNLDAAEASRESRSQLGEMIAAMGGDPTSGSNADIIYQSQIERQYELLNLRYGAASKADSLRSEARQSRAAGRNALFGGIVNAGVAALGGYQDLKDRGEERAARKRLYSAQNSGQIAVPRTTTTGGGGLYGSGLMSRRDQPPGGYDPIRILRKAGYGG